MQYRINKVRLLFDRTKATARLLGRDESDMATPLDLSHSYLRAMSPIHLRYLKNMGVVSSMSISLEDNSKDRLWGLVCCHSYGNTATRVPFRVRELCHLVGLTASIYLSNILSSDKLQVSMIVKARRSDDKPEVYATASPVDLLHLFKADFGFLVVNGEAKTIGKSTSYNESIVLLHYLRLRKSPNVLSTNCIHQEFQNLEHKFQTIAGALLIPLSLTNLDFIVFFRRDQVKQVHWAGKPSHKEDKPSTLEPRESFEKWTENVVGTSKDWTPEQRMSTSVLIHDQVLVH
jgi:light-regulated signal transduction histidine kinase (bacteriophytochrome)